ncbi:glycosyltransferase [Pseudooceanicola sediminis]|uniref:Glycosyltransferase n=1 Tax=Pseudooceanicola sediminis TaxID=2211117 RepID=A0A399IXP7_9RHOB|nr:glycosyltransferase [Pseudooceanicola sediminis]KAA2313164.1 glycosyltransferase [Puniceibacterium sp. HSS470]RII37811.1 glycosyltransferase [Pseudooceanicola sediminis]|tara:strand:- start:21579 stop:22559 length:981 start_codon:yes stop_codon:yes gene_type:complete
MPDLLCPTAIVIPARNESARILLCLQALVAQCGTRAAIHVVVNNTAGESADDTAERVRAFADQTAVPILVQTLRLTPSQGVGTARARGAAAALRTQPRLAHILTTDADCIVAPDWLERSLSHLSEVEAVCGHVTPMVSEAAILDRMDAQLATMEGRYRALVLAFYAAHAPETTSPSDHHGEAAGASLALRAATYLSVGGFRALATGEDRDLVRRLKTAGHSVRHAGDVRVQASCRLAGRAKGGMAAALRDRTCGSDYLIDDALPPPDWLVKHRAQGTLGVWPPHLPPDQRLRASELAPHIRRLEGILAGDTRISPFGLPQIATHDA